MRIGVVHLLLDGSHVFDFLEKKRQGAGVINAGCYVLPKRTLDAFAMDSVFSLESDFLALQVKQQEFLVCVADGYFIDIGIPQDYLRTQQELAGEKVAS